MEAQSPANHRHPYMGKGHSIKVDVVTRQALVSPIFRKQSVPPISERYVKIFDPVSNNLESQSDENYLLESKLYDKYKTIFNNISAEAIINLKKTKPESDIESDKSSFTCESHNCKISNTKRKRAKTIEPETPSLDSIRSKSDYLFVKPWIQYLPSIVESIYRLSRNKGDFHNKIQKKKKLHDGLKEIPSSSSLEASERSLSDDHRVNTKASTDWLGETEEDKEKISYKYVKNLAYSLLTFVNTIDDWNHRVDEAMCRTGVDRITLNEAKSLLQEFRASTSGILSSRAADKLECAIARTEEYRVEIRRRLAGIFEDTEENTADLEDVENFLKQGMNTTFMTPEYLTLNQVFYNISALRHLIVESLIQSEFEVCSSLLEKSGEYSLKIPDVEIIRKHVENSLWLYQAQKYTQKPANYTLVSELLENTPEELKDTKIYKHLSAKLQMTLEWMNKFDDPKFNRIIMYETIKSNRYSDKTKGESDSVGNENRRTEVLKEVSKEPKLTPEELESAYNGYQNLEMTIPSLRNIEPVYNMWRRFKRRLRKLETLLASDSKVNGIMESLLVLQQAEAVTEYVDTAELLEPLRNEVEVALTFERKCRSVLNRFNNWSVTVDTMKLKTEWNALINFKRTATVNSSDLTDMINIIKAYLSRSTDAIIDETNNFNDDATTNFNDDATTKMNNGETRNLSFDEEVKTGPEDKLDNNKARVANSKNKESKESRSEKGSRKIQFSELVELYEEFHKLKVKNWQQFRNVEDIYKLGLELRDKVSVVTGSIKEGLRTDELVSNLILVSLETIRYGANMSLEEELLKALKYCLWSKKLYGALNKLYRQKSRESEEKKPKEGGYQPETEDGEGIKEENWRHCEALLRRLASEPERDAFKEYVNAKNTIAHHLNLDTRKAEDVGGANARAFETNNSQREESINRELGAAEEIGADEGANGGQSHSKTRRKDSRFRGLVVSKEILAMTELEVVIEFTKHTAR
ncbi:uncharacterized protein TOT_010001325 [Theileria orientalis strain Shintoku]|uniref:Lysine-specific demethylase-like domain-containing protein n=1 Tax=Theileria orientalis strain Shintoku TaxID=869250 RepID=J4C2X5_THEOR|nr:uncharacterized protein TOT_010001325 [Theileria orientalis strain Shintoku]BAM39451.1 uncharacterized protein TOT_010001325 [Theileria orientalis strain Shintoku]|eukprot:XP_009689752.1 uncharacterized protein TOT_010001325 [Theileria orientalis strain Shintoku]